MKFKALCHELGLHANDHNEETLAVIKKWCEDNVSRDLHFIGSVSEKYSRYMALAKVYLDEFLPHLSMDMSAIIPVFDGRNAIQEAAFNGLDRVIMTLNPKGEILNEPNQSTMTPLHLAALEGFFHTVSALMTLGASPYKSNQQQQLPIFSALLMPMLHDEALKENKAKIYRLLKEHAPDTVKQLDSNDDTVLQLMAIHGFSTLMAELLNTNPELAYIPNKHTHYPVHTAILNHQADCVRLLLQQKDVAMLADNNGRGALHYAARYGDKALVTLCCELINNLDSPDACGITPFMLAAEAGNIAAMKTLMEHGARVDLVDKEGFTALHHAVSGRSTQGVTWLLENTEIDIHAPSYNQQTALSICERIRHDEIKTLLMHHE